MENANDTYVRGYVVRKISDTEFQVLDDDERVVHVACSMAAATDEISDIWVRETRPQSARYKDDLSTPNAPVADTAEVAELPVRTPEERIAKALAHVVDYGLLTDPAHKDWLIDQMVRALTGCPVVHKSPETGGPAYTYSVQGESEAYRQVIAKACANAGAGVEKWPTGETP
jgi:hypothetical protein